MKPILEGTKTSRFVCLHGHFYQPPRENPWLEAVEIQDSAAPFHDWNDRITSECYEANASAHVLDEQGRLVDVMNNYGWISFDFGPTLLAWLERQRPQVYAAILEGDRESRARFGGHGSALLHPYNHMIMPLATLRDKITQLEWGLHDFRRRFGRAPEGLWLPETAVDNETLALACDLGIRFTVLSSSQAFQIFAPDGTSVDPASQGVDTTRPYRVMLAGGRSLAVFFYDARLSQAISFEGLLQNGEALRARLLNGFDPVREGPQLISVATDGETYGHHHKFGDMALAYVLRSLDRDPSVSLTNYAAYLDAFGAEWTVVLSENTSWSCSHGIARWQDHCGCASGTHPGWTQTWRRPLRQAMDGLRDQALPAYESALTALGIDPWAIRNDYIRVLLDRDAEHWEWLFHRHVPGGGDPATRVRVAKCLELARHALLMYTSCGWFFDEISGLEAVQVLRYAGRVIQLAADLFPELDLEGPFLARLAEAPSNYPPYADGAAVYQALVRPAIFDERRIAAQYAIQDLFDETPADTPAAGYERSRQHHALFLAGSIKAVVGQVRVRSLTTLADSEFSYGALHLGDHVVRAGVDRPWPEAVYEALVSDLNQGFGTGNLAAVIRTLEASFDGLSAALEDLPKDDHRAILDQILRDGLTDAEEAYRQIHDRRALWLAYLQHAAIPVPRALAIAAEMALQGRLRRALEASPLDLGRIQAILTEAERVAPSAFADSDLPGTVESLLLRLSEGVSRRPDDPRVLAELQHGIRLIAMLPFAVDLRRVRTRLFRIVRVLPERTAVAETDDGREALAEICDTLAIRIPDPARQT